MNGVLWQQRRFLLCFLRGRDDGCRRGHTYFAKRVCCLGKSVESGFSARHSLLVDKPPKDFGSRLQHRLRQFLVFIYLVPPRVVRRAWLPTLKHSSSAPDARALLIWALGMERDSLRNACLGFQRFLAGGRIWHLC